MTRIEFLEHRIQRRDSDRMLQRLRLPGDHDAGSALVLLLCLTGMVAAVLLGWCL